MKGHVFAVNVLDCYGGKTVFVIAFVLLYVAAVREQGKVLICDKGPHKVLMAILLVPSSSSRNLNTVKIGLNYFQVIVSSFLHEKFPGEVLKRSKAFGNFLQG